MRPTDLLRFARDAATGYPLRTALSVIAMAIGAERRRQIDKTRVVQIGVMIATAVLGYTWFSSPSNVAIEQGRSTSPISVTLLQGNIPQDLKFGEGVDLALRNYKDALLASSSELTDRKSVV